MLFIIGRLRISPENQPDFVALARELVVHERQQPGCLGFDILQDVTERNSFIMLEQWQDRAALERHVSSDAFARNEERLSRLIDGDPLWDEYETA